MDENRPIELTQEAQRAQAQALAAASLSHYALQPDGLQFIADTQNTVFRLDAGGQRYALRIHRPGSRTTSAIRGELLWLLALRQDTGLVVPEPVATVEGALVYEASLPGDAEPRQIVLFHWIEGNRLAEHLSAATLRMAGAFMARLHRHAESFRLPADAQRAQATWDEVREWDTRYPPARYPALARADHDLCSAAARRLSTILSQIDPRDCGLIHSDLHQFNYLYRADPTHHRPGELCAIDFDDCAVAPFAYDVAVSFFHLDDHPDYAALRSAFLDGYATVRQPPPEAYIRAFMAVRAFVITAWILSWPDLTWQSFGPDMLNSALARIRTFLSAP